MGQHRPTEGYGHPDGGHHGGMGYQPRPGYSYVYAGYPWLLPFGYGLATGDDSSMENDNAAQTAPPPPDFSNEPPAAAPPEVAATDAPMFRPLYQPTPVEAPVHAQPATTLVFKDGRPSIEVHNYALTGNTLYALDGETRQDIPLSELNLPATIDANRKTGVDFAIPSSY